MKKGSESCLDGGRRQQRQTPLQPSVIGLKVASIMCLWNSNLTLCHLFALVLIIPILLPLLFQMASIIALFLRADVLWKRFRSAASARVGLIKHWRGNGEKKWQFSQTGSKFLSVVGYSCVNCVILANSPESLG
jgi:hypothetical protein